MKDVAERVSIADRIEQRIPYARVNPPYVVEGRLIRMVGLTLEAEVDRVWLRDARNLPNDLVAVPDDWNFSTGPKRLAALDLDYCFTGFGGKATMHWPETGIRLLIEADGIFGHLVVFVPPGENFVCVEPVSNVTNAVHQLAGGRTDTGLKILEPGETLSGAMGFAVEA